MKKIASHLINNIISLLFTIVATQILLYSILRQYKLGYSIILALLTVVIFSLFSKVVELKEKGPILYIVVAAIFCVPSYILVMLGNQSSSTDFLSWAKNGGLNIGDTTGFIIAAVLLVAFTFTSLAYYFSVTIFRMPMMILLHFIVMIFYLKGMYSRDMIAPSILVVLLVALLLTRKDKKEDEDIQNNIQIKHLLITGSGFVLVIFLIGYVIPKSNILPTIPPLDAAKSYLLSYIADDDIDVDNADNYIVGSVNKRDINKSLGKRTNKLLYTFEGLNPGYLVDHNFDQYKDERWIESDPSKKREEDQDYTKYYSVLSDTLAILNSTNHEDAQLNKAKSAKDIISSHNIINLKAENYLTDQLAHPSKTRECLTPGNDEFSQFVNAYNQLIFRDESHFGLNQKYSIEYSPDEPISGSKEEVLMKSLNYEMFKSLYINSGQVLADQIINGIAAENSGYTGASIDKTQLAKTSIENAINNVDEIYNEYTELDRNTSVRLINLGKELTKNKTSNYDKAKNIEQYFTGGNFKYDLELPKQNGEGDYIDFFIFEGKQGYCVQYATAMTLLCRASGVPARYTEGYLITEDNEVDGKYQVTESQGHAFVEVYIPGYGWKIFDPTPAGVREVQAVEKVEGETKNSIKIDFKKIASIVIPVILVVCFIVAMIFIFLKVTKRSRFIRKARKLKNEDTLESLISNCIKLLEDLDLSPYKGETLLNFSIRVDRSLQIGFNNLIKIYYQYKYAGKSVTDEDIEEALKVNGEIYENTK